MDEKVTQDIEKLKTELAKNRVLENACMVILRYVQENHQRIVEEIRAMEVQ